MFAKQKKESIGIESIELGVKRLDITVSLAQQSYYALNSEDLKKALIKLFKQLRTDIGNLKKLLAQQDNPFNRQAIISAWKGSKAEYASKLTQTSSLIDESLKFYEKELIKNYLSDIEQCYEKEAQLTDYEMKHAIKERFFLGYLDKLSNQLKAETGPSCFICYAWGNQADTSWVHGLAWRLRQVGINVLLDVWYNKTGPVSAFIQKVNQTDTVLVIGTPELRQKWLAYTNSDNLLEDEKDLYSGNVVSQELEMIDQRRKNSLLKKAGVFKVTLTGENKISYPDFLVPDGESETNFVDITQYEVKFFNLVEIIYHHAISRNQKQAEEWPSRLANILQEKEKLFTVFEQVDKEHSQQQLKALYERAKQINGIGNPSPSPNLLEQMENLVPNQKANNSPMLFPILEKPQAINTSIKKQIEDFFHIAKFGNLEALKNNFFNFKDNSSLKKSISSYINQNDETVLMAAISNNIDVVKKTEFLVHSFPESIYTINSDGHNILHKVSSLHKADVLQVLLKIPKIDQLILQQTISAETPVSFAILNREFDVAKSLFETLEDHGKVLLLEKVDQEKDTILHRIIKVGSSFNFFNFFIPYANKCVIEKYNKKGRTILHEAVIYNNAEIAFLLIEKKANIGTVISDDADIDKDNDMDSRFPKQFWGTTLLHSAKEKILNKLLEIDQLDVNDANNCFRCTPLHYAVVERNLNKINVLMKSGAKVLAETIEGMTCLHLAAMKGFVEAIEPLLEANEKLLLIQDKFGMTALHWSILKNKVGLSFTSKALINAAKKYGLLEDLLNIRASSSNVTYHRDESANVAEKTALDLLDKNVNYDNDIKWIQDLRNENNDQSDLPEPSICLTM